MFLGPVLAKFQAASHSFHGAPISPRGWGGGLVAGHGLQEIAHTWLHTSYRFISDMVAGHSQDFKTSECEG